MGQDQPFSRDRFDEMMVRIGTQAFDLQRMLARFTAEILEQFEGQEAELDAEIPAEHEGAYGIVRAVKVFFTADEEIRVAVSGVEKPLEWEALDLSAQQSLALRLHTRYTEEKIYRKLSSPGDFH